MERVVREEYEWELQVQCRKDQMRTGKKPKGMPAASVFGHPSRQGDIFQT